jgi:hypothetical protein
MIVDRRATHHSRPTRSPAAGLGRLLSVEARQWDDAREAEVRRDGSGEISETDIDSVGGDPYGQTPVQCRCGGANPSELASVP